MKYSWEKKKNSESNQAFKIQVTTQRKHGGENKWNYTKV